MTYLTALFLVFAAILTVRFLAFVERTDMPPEEIGAAGWQAMIGCCCFGAVFLGEVTPQDFLNVLALFGWR